MVIVSGRTSAIANGTTTVPLANPGTTTIQGSPSNASMKLAFGRPAMLRGGQIVVSVTAGGAATGNLQIFVEDSFDNGATWNDLAASKVFAFGGSVQQQVLQLYGTQNPGPGTIRSVTGTVPATGSDISDVVPAGARWQLQGIKAVLTTSATVANRVVSALIDDGSNTLQQFPATANEVAGTAYTNIWSPGIVGQLNTPVATWSLGQNLLLASGFHIKTATLNLQAGDAWTSIFYDVVEWRGLDGAVQATETFPASTTRSGQFASLIRVREVVSSIGGSPTGPTYSVFGFFD